MMKKILILASVVALALPLGLTGCKGRAEQEAEVKRLQTELTNAKAASSKAKKERDALAAELNTVTQARDKLQEQVNELEKLTLARDQWRKQVAELTGSRDEFKGQLAEMTGSRDSLQNKLAEATRTHDELQQQVRTLTASRETALAEARRAEAKIKELTTQLQAETAKVSELQEQLQSVAVQMEESVEAPTIKAIESPVIRTFTTTRPQIRPGQKSILSWWVTDADRVRIEPDIGSVGTLGSRTIAPTKTTTFTLIAANDAGESRVTRRVEVQ